VVPYYLWVAPCYLLGAQASSLWGKELVAGQEGDSAVAAWHRVLFDQAAVPVVALEEEVVGCYCQLVGVAERECWAAGGFLVVVQQEEEGYLHYWQWQDP